MSTIDSPITMGITLSTAGNYTSPLTITSTGAVHSTGNAIYGPAGTAWTVANSGVIGADQNGILLKTGGLVDNTNLISAGFSGIEIDGAAGTVMNSGTIQGGGTSGITLGAGGTVANYVYGFIYGNAQGVRVAGAAGTLTNSGTISGGIGAFLAADGTVSNSGTILGNIGVFLAAGGTVTNSGRIASTGSSGTGVYLKVGGTVTNHGLIAATVGSSGDGVRLVAGGAVTNNGSIVGSFQGVDLLVGGLVNNLAFGVIQGGYGVTSLGGVTTIVNAGRISGTSFSGVYLDSGTIIDSGIIDGSNGIAVAFGTGGSNLLVLEPGYKLYGIAVGGGPAVSDTLQLAGSSRGTVANIGTQFVNFDTVTIAAGADWTVAGSNTIAGGITLAAGATLGVAGTIAAAGTAVLLSINDVLRLESGWALQGTVAGG
ncbi:MAG TPA: hypothetical protein VGQ90_01855, partial [Stellaceae bacterium]|nr:hypothetical protein [Stellaceae bacterium]